MTLAEAVAAAERRIADIGIATARLDARILVCHAVGVPDIAVISEPERLLSRNEEIRIARAVARRLRREPVARILGQREFWSLSFHINRATLDPRPDSETLVQAVLDRIPDRGRPLEILDLGTGTGCLLLALLSELPAARGFGIDISKPALRVAERNARELGLRARARFAEGDWAATLDADFDLVVSNPPYLDEQDLFEVQPEVAFDPLQALDGGPGGLAAYRRIVPALPRLLRPAGFAALEIGRRQAAAVTRLLADATLTVELAVKDLGGHDRVLLAHSPAVAQLILPLG